ncbi:MAG: mannose-6-phosphate isomerase, class I [Actinomycetia bacterium]|nr:mannose-6-phosphate isomerase, class I [Actinomycetes bacterium]
MTLSPMVIRGAVRNYDWGVVDGLVAWGAPRDGLPQAEMWFGFHPAAPSPLRDDSARSLADVWPDYQPPLLVKILAAASPLSIQVHPTAAQVDRMMANPASAELLADRVEKTEMLMAVDPFVTLTDWRPTARAQALLSAAGAAPDVLAAVAAGDHAAAVERLLGEDRLQLTPSEWAAISQQAGLSEVEQEALAAVAQHFGADPGVAVAALLQPQLLQPGDAAYVPAGVPHAYVHGLGVEVMRNSDNVLRLGLTSKTVSVPDSLAALEMDRHASLIHATTDDTEPADAPFRSAQVSGTATLATPGYRLLLVLTGQATAQVAGDEFSLVTGDALAIPAGTDPVVVTATGRTVALWATD